MSKYEHRVFEVLIDDNENKIIFVPTLKKLFLVPIKTEVPKFINSEKEPIKCYNRPPDYKFRAAHLIINNICNLKCIYCYANAGEQEKRVMPLEIAVHAVERVAKNTGEMGFDTFGVGLIGGEPTMSMCLVEQVVDESRKIAKRYGLISRIGIVSNGVFGEKVRKYVINNLDYITISLDGTKDMQDKHRPLRNGNGSFDSVFENAKLIYESGLIVGFRCTVSSYSVEKLPEIIVFLNNHFPKSTIGIEPLQECGRCLTTNTYMPNSMQYAENLVKTIHIANERNIKIKSSVLRFKCQPSEISFCGVNGQNFAINPEGYVTGCTRVTSKEDSMSDKFYYGKYDFDKKDFVFDQERYDWLKTLTVDNIKECEDCFARYNCKGDCSIVKSDFAKDFSISKSPKCESIQMATKELFKMQLELS